MKLKKREIDLILLAIEINVDDFIHYNTLLQLMKCKFIQLKLKMLEFIDLTRPEYNLLSNVFYNHIIHNGLFSEEVAELGLELAEWQRAAASDRVYGYIDSPIRITKIG